jgi:hypothetical protein
VEIKLIALKKKLVEFQHKNDILLIFIVYLILIIIMQYSSTRVATPMYNSAYSSPYIQQTGMTPAASAPPMSP